MPSQAEEFRITSAVQQGLDKYLGLVGPRTGFFYVSEDGRAYGASFCRSHRCNNEIQARRTAEEQCTSRTDKDCVLIAKGRNMQFKLVLLD